LAQFDAELVVFAPWFVGQLTEPVPPASWLMLATSTALFVTLTMPATCGQEFDPLFAVQLTPGVLARGANKDWNSTPEEAVELLETTVLLIKSVASAS
jgi:hypothetical protein